MLDLIRGEIWRVDFDPTEGSEIGKARPAVIIGDERLGKLPVRVVVPVTGWHPRYQNHPWMTRINPDEKNGLTKTSAADALQIRTISLLRFQEMIGVLPSAILDEIAGRIALCVRAPMR